MCYGLKRLARLLLVRRLHRRDYSGFSSIPPLRSLRSNLMRDRAVRRSESLCIYMYIYSQVYIVYIQYSFGNLCSYDILPLRDTIRMVKMPRNHHCMCVYTVYTVYLKTNCRHLYFPETSLQTKRQYIYIFINTFRLSRGKSLVFSFPL